MLSLYFMLHYCFQLQEKFDSVCQSSLEAIEALESVERITRSGRTET